MIEISINYKNKITEYILNRSKEKYINEEIIPENTNHTYLIIKSEFQDLRKIFDIGTETFKTFYAVFYTKSQEEIRTQLIIANIEIKEEDEKFQLFQEKLNSLLQEESTQEIDINSQIFQNQEKVDNSIHRIKEPEKTEIKINLKKLSELEPEERLKELPIIINSKISDDLTENSEKIEDIKIELDNLERYQYKISNNSNIMALLYYLFRNSHIRESQKEKINVEIAKNEFDSLYTKFQDLTKENVKIEPNLVTYFHLEEIGNLERKEEILSYNTSKKITGKQFYQLQFDVIKTKIKALDYMFSLTDFKNKGIVKFKEDKKKKILNISLDRKRTNIVIDWNLLGIKNIELEIKK